MGRRVVLLLVALLALWGLATPAQAVPPPRTVAELVDRLREDPVQVNRMMGLGHTDEVDAALTDLADRAPVPVYVVLDLLPQELELREHDPDTAERLIARLSAELGPGLYVLTLGETAESIIGHSDAAVSGVDEAVLSRFRSGSSHSYDLTDYSGTEGLRVYLGLRSVVEGSDAVEALRLGELEQQVPWAFPGSLEDRRDSLALRTGATVVVPVVLAGLLLGVAAHLRRARRRARLPGRTSVTVVGVVVGVLALPLAGGLTFAALTPQVAPLPGPGEQEQAAAAAFRAGQHVYLSPDLEGWLGESLLRRIEDAAAAAPVTARIAVWYPTQDTDALELTAAALGDPALYLTASPDEVDGFTFRLDGGSPPFGSSWSVESDPETLTEEVLDALDDGDVADYRPVPATTSRLLGDHAGETLGIAAAIAVMAAAPLFGVGWLLGWPSARRIRARATGSAGRREQTTPRRRGGARVPEDAPAGRAVDDSASVDPTDADPPAGVVAVGHQQTSAATTGGTVDGLVPRTPVAPAAGEQEGWLRSARYELGNLGRTLRFLGPTASASPAAEAARRHVEAAEQLVDTSARPADHLGAWVLARRGSEAAAAATALQPFEPTVGCWFHPEHPRGTEQRSFEGRSVPCCRRCADSVDAGREPPVLDLLGADGEPVHFHRSGIEPWASTGYGATEPDLPGRL